MLPLRAAINKAKKENNAVRRENVTVDQNGDTRTVNIEVIPLKNLRERCFLVLFEDAKNRRALPAHLPVSGRRRRAPRVARKNLRRAAALERELAETRDYLQSMQEQHEAANEELQASNEEVQSANEELQSINEELETSKEELESANEELTTVNEEMANRNTELNRLNSDLRQSEAKFKLLFEHSPLPKWAFDSETFRFVDVNTAAVQHYGYSRGEFLAMSILDVRTPEAGASLKAAIARAPHPLPKRETCQHRKKSGEVIDVEVAIQRNHAGWETGVARQYHRHHRAYQARARARDRRRAYGHAVARADPPGQEQPADYRCNGQD